MSLMSPGVSFRKASPKKPETLAAPPPTPLVTSYLCISSSLRPPPAPPDEKCKASYPPSLNAVSAIYNPKITSLYPPKSLAECDFDGTVRFSMPRGVEALDELSLPKIHYFVQTRECGTRCYAACMTFWEEETLELREYFDIEWNTTVTDSAVEHVLECHLERSLYPQNQWTP